MHFFLDYLSHFSASEILHMYGEGSFRTCEEIKLADFAISFKIIFHDHHISSEELQKYRHMQNVVDAVRVHQKSVLSTEEFHIYFSSEAVYFNYFVKYSEEEKEVTKFNVFERRVSFSFHPVSENFSAIIWMKDALDELLTYVLRDAAEGDRVGLIIKYENLQSRNAAFPIKFTTHLKTSIIFDTLTSLLETRESMLTGQIMNLQIVRIRLPVLYKKLTTEDVMPMKI